MKIFFYYLLRTMIPPFMITIVVLPAYLLEWIQSQTSFIAFLLLSGIAGTILQYFVEKWQKRKQVEGKKKKSVNEHETDDSLSKLPKEVQELIKEGESLSNENPSNQ